MKPLVPVQTCPKHAPELAAHVSDPDSSGQPANIRPREIHQNHVLHHIDVQRDQIKHAADLRVEGSPSPDQEEVQFILSVTRKRKKKKRRVKCSQYLNSPCRHTSVPVENSAVEVNKGFNDSVANASLPVEDTIDDMNNGFTNAAANTNYKITPLRPEVPSPLDIKHHKLTSLRPELQEPSNMKNHKLTPLRPEVPADVKDENTAMTSHPLLDSSHNSTNDDRVMPSSMDRPIGYMQSDFQPPGYGPPSSNLQSSRSRDRSATMTGSSYACHVSSPLSSPPQSQTYGCEPPCHQNSRRPMRMSPELLPTTSLSSASMTPNLSGVTTHSVNDIPQWPYPSFSPSVNALALDSILDASGLGESRRPLTGNEIYVTGTPNQVPSAYAIEAANGLILQNRRPHPQNMLVDIAETCQEVFPFAAVAERHNQPIQKVFDAFSAVIQLPLLRSAANSRRAGKFGAARMKEFRQAKREVREQHILEKKNLGKSTKPRGNRGPTLGQHAVTSSERTSESINSPEAFVGYAASSQSFPDGSMYEAKQPPSSVSGSTATFSADSFPGCLGEGGIDLRLTAQAITRSNFGEDKSDLRRAVQVITRGYS